jgi:hypothetical protein
MKIQKLRDYIMDKRLDFTHFLAEFKGKLALEVYLLLAWLL